MNEDFIRLIINSFDSPPKENMADFYKSNEFLSLIDKSRKNNFPIYSLLILLQVENRLDKNNTIKISDGWAAPALDKLITDLYAENERLKKIKLIDFPNIDKKWRVAFMSTLATAVIITSLLLFRTSYYVDKSESLKKEKTEITNKKIELEQKVDEYTTVNQDIDEELDDLNADYLDANEKIKSLQNIISNKNSELNQLKSNLIKLRRSYNDQKDIVDKYQEELKSLNFDIEFLKKKISILEGKIKNVRDVKFNINLSYNDNCNTKFIEPDKLYFDTYHAVLIRSIKVVSKKKGYCEFYIKDNSTSEVKRKKVLLKKGIQTVNLNISVSEGKSHYLSSHGVKLLAIKDCYNFPYTITNLIELTKNNNNKYPPYYEWVVSADI